MPSQTLTDKRLESLRRQLYGKDASEKKVKKYSLNSLPQESGKSTYSLSSQKISTHTTPEDSSYLKKDLLKVLAFSSLALLTQIALYLASLKNLINLNFHF